MRPRALVLGVSVAAFAWMPLGCYSLAQPSYRPGDARELLVAIARRGVTVERSVAGESACGDPGLKGNALHLVASTAADPATRDIYIYTFRPRSWEASQASVDACQADYAQARPAAAIKRVDVPTWRTLGADWSAELETAIHDALVEASTQGD